MSGRVLIAAYMSVPVISMYRCLSAGLSSAGFASCAAPTASGVLTTRHCCRPNFSSALVTYSSWSSVMVRAFRSRVMRMPSIHVAVCSCLMLKRSCSSATLCWNSAASSAW